MIGWNWQWVKRRLPRVGAGLWVVLLVGLLGCGDRPLPVTQVGTETPASLTRGIAETSPPAIFQDLRQDLDRYQPQVTLLSPRPGQVIDDDKVTVKIRVADLPVFKDSTIGLGPHIHIFLDDQPAQSVYDANQTLVFQGLSPGTHTIRALAVRPWDEAFKNEGAFAQVTFHSYTQTPKNNPDPARPLLTYNSPQGRYGAEPVMLDFFLTNAPLHLIAQERSDDDIKDWRIRCTVNGESFIFDEWQPIYLKGLKPGKNWVQLELLDEDGRPFENAFNNAVRLITYEPGGTDPLAQLVRGDLAIAEVRGIVDPTYTPPAPEPEPEPEPSPEPTPDPTDSARPDSSEATRPEETPPAPASSEEDTDLKVEPDGDRDEIPQTPVPEAPSTPPDRPSSEIESGTAEDFEQAPADLPKSSEEKPGSLELDAIDDPNEATSGDLEPLTEPDSLEPPAPTSDETQPSEAAPTPDQPRVEPSPDDERSPAPTPNPTEPKPEPQTPPDLPQFI